MSLPQAAALGVVEGITEYLPVSSTGHLILAQRVMGIGGYDETLPPEAAQQAKEAADAYAICIQGGAILAVLVLYWRRFMQMARGLGGQSADGRRMAINLIVALSPLVVIVFLEKAIKHHLFGLWPVTAAWFVGGVAILAVAWWRKAQGHTPREGKSLEQLTWQLALIIGAAQCIAVWPGVSRSLVTIVAGVLVGLSLPAAVEFSFLLGVITLLAATAKDFAEYHQQMFDAYGPVSMAVGFIFAFISAVLAVKWMVGYLNKHGLQLFGYYRVALAIIVAVWLIFFNGSTN